MDYTTEQQLRQKNTQLKLELSRLSGKIGMLEVQKADIDDDIKAAKATFSEMSAQIAAGKEELAEICEIKTMAERDQVAEEAQHQLDELQSAYGFVDDFCDAAKEDIAYGAFNLVTLVKDFLFDWGHIGARIQELIHSISEKIRSITLFEWIKNVRPENQKANILQARLDETIANAGRWSDASGRKNHENSKNDVTIELARGIRG